VARGAHEVARDARSTTESEAVPFGKPDPGRLHIVVLEIAMMHTFDPESGVARIVAGVAVGVLLSAGVIDGQTVVTSPANTCTAAQDVEQQSRHSHVAGGEPPLMRHFVAPPASDLTTYIEGQLVQVSIPSNWRELPGSNAVAFAPEGAYGNAGVKSVFTHGLGMGLARNDKGNLRMTTGDFIEAYVLVSQGTGRTFHYSTVTIGDRPGLRTTLSRVSEATGALERIEMFTTLLRDGTLFYVLTVAPRDCAADYAGTFRRVVRSIRIMDCDGCVR
jgi:hypothetical protein